MKPIRSLALVGCALGIALFWLSGCGHPVCVGGIGDCEVMTRTKKNPTVSTGDLLMTANATTVRVNSSVNLTISQGVAPYLDLVVQPAGLGRLTKRSNTQWTYVPTQAPNPPNKSYPVTITATDSTKPTADYYPLTITVIN
jgi:hypothetical protein